MASRKKTASGARNPVLPSEAEILEFIQSSDARVGKREIARAFGIKGGDRIELKRILRKMKDDGLLAGERRRLHEPHKLPPVAVVEVAGSDSDGELYGRPVNWDTEALGDAPRILVKPDSKPQKRNARTPGEGDRLLARLRETGETAPEGYAYEAQIIRVLSKSGGVVLGVFRPSRTGGNRIVQVDKRARSDLLVEEGHDGGAKSGELVTVELMKGRGAGLPRARVKERIGKVGDQKSISLIAIHQHGLPNKFSDETLREAAMEQPFQDGVHEDLRSTPLITIDPPDARDHDDAVWACADDDEKNQGGFRVIVAIADVAHYVQPSSALDRQARERGNSVYFPDRVVPMLPEELSAGLCSLRPQEDRPALAVSMTFDREGKKRAHRFSRILMRSAAKLSYEQAQRAIDGHPDDVTDPLLDGVLRPLWNAYRTVERERRRRAPLDLNLPERKIIFDDNGNIERIVTPPRLDVHKLIEEFMIQANVCAAETLEAQKAPIIFRVHDAPAVEKVSSLAEFLGTLDIKLALGQNLKPKQFNQILAKVKGKDIEHLVNEVVLRAQAQAIYSPENRGHFGLNLRRYAHFTSPIRRYADLMVHRSLIAALKLGAGGLSDWDVQHLYETAELISMTERRAMMAERDTVDRLVASHLANKVGAEFSGRIAGVTSAGLFIELDDIGANGFVPISTVGAEYYHHDADRHALIGERTGETFRLADRVDVRLEEVTPLAGGLKLQLLSRGRPGKPPARTQRRSRHSPRTRSRRR